MERWDVYDKDRVFTGKTHIRGEAKTPQEYHVVIHGWVMNGAGEVLLTCRDIHKPYGGLWEVTGGSVQAGEDSLTATVREIGEETGIVLVAQDGILIRSKRYDKDGIFYDVYLFYKDIPIVDIICQEGETTDAKWVTEEEFDALYKKGEIVPTLGYYKEVFLQYGCKGK